MTFQLQMFCNSEIIKNDTTRTPGNSLSSHGPIPSGLTDLVGTVCLNIPQTDPPPSRWSLPCSGFSLWSQDPGFLKADLTGKDWAEVLIEFLGLFHVTRSSSHPSPNSTPEEPGFLKSIPEHWDSVLAVFLGHPFLLPPLAPFRNSTEDCYSMNTETTCIHSSDKLLLALNTPLWLHLFTNWVYFSNTWPRAKETIHKRCRLRTVSIRAGSARKASQQQLIRSQWNSQLQIPQQLPSPSLWHHTLRVKLGGNKYNNRVILLPMFSCNWCRLKSSSTLNLSWYISTNSYNTGTTEIQLWIWIWTTQPGSLSGTRQVPRAFARRCVKPFVRTRTKSEYKACYF